MKAPSRLITPFASVADAWIWTMQALLARRDGARIGANRGAVARPCEPDDIVLCLDRLYRRRVVELAHARVLRIHGERGCPPPEGSGEARLWNEAMAAMDKPLRLKGIVR